jgi:hypothetical protein
LRQKLYSNASFYKVDGEFFFSQNKSTPWKKCKSRDDFE